jgi:hypothetical protein
MGNYKRQHQMPARYFEGFGRDDEYLERGRRFKPKKRKLKDFDGRTERREQDNGR